MPDQDPCPSPSRRSALSAPEAYAELAALDFTRYDLRGVLAEVADIARATLTAGDVDGGTGRHADGAERDSAGSGPDRGTGDVRGEVSLTLIRSAQAYTAAYTGEPALALDEVQYRAGHGPCVDAAGAGQTLLVADTASETRWPEFAAAAADRGIGSSLSVHLPVQETTVGALNIYSPRRDAFDGAAVETGTAFAGYAAVAIRNAHLYESVSAQARQMREAMEYRAVIEQAKGIVMCDRRCTPEEAFDVLRSLSNATNRKLRDVASMLVVEAQTKRR